MALREINKNSTVARGNGFIYNQKKTNKKNLFKSIAYTLTILSKTTNTNNASSLFQKTISKS